MITLALALALYGTNVRPQSPIIPMDVIAMPEPMTFTDRRKKRKGDR